MAILSVRYRVTVYCNVDTRTGEILSVTEDGDSIRLDTLPADDHSPAALVACGVVEDEHGRAVAKRMAKRAFDIAENADEWPAWDR